MKKIDGELISALLDGEIAPEEQQTALTSMLEAGPAASETFGRYRLIGDLMRDESTPIVSVADRVREALRDEPAILAPQRPERRSRWIRPLAGAALAASVAAAAIVVAPQLLDGGLQPAAEALVMAPGNEPPATFLAAVPEPALQMAALDDKLDVRPASPDGSRWQALDRSLEDRLDRLVIEHHEFGGRTGVNGPVPHIGFVSYDGR
ncbi:MAG: sigma-E factor negative regulatory protein [Gammaproteobacteria bacterium]|nr:sigma-E factor negative regulatory protein [Gammaproteobacteria bacterium]